MKNNKGFSTIEVLSIIIIIGIVLICGLVIAFGAKKRGEMAKFQDKAVELLDVSKQFYNDIKRDNSDLIVNQNGSNGLCVTLEGLHNNDYYSGDLKDYDGYIIIEEQNNNIIYTLWMANKKFVIDGVDYDSVKDSKKEKLVKDYDNQEYSSKVKSSFKGNNGTYSKACIDSKI